MPFIQLKISATRKFYLANLKLNGNNLKIKKFNNFTHIFHIYTTSASNSNPQRYKATTIHLNHDTISHHHRKKYMQFDKMTQYTQIATSLSHQQNHNYIHLHDCQFKPLQNVTEQAHTQQRPDHHAACISSLFGFLNTNISYLRSDLYRRLNLDIHRRYYYYCADIA